jgi:regulator of protease activity HflC (stomatin/prohibitin superfamily)
MDAAALAFAAFILLIVAALFILRGAWVWAHRKREAGIVTVMDYEAALKFRKGAFETLLGPGRYYTWPEPVTIQRVDKRVFTASVAGQEILTADQLPLRVSVLATYRVTDPKAYIVVASQPVARMHEEVQMALRRRIAAHKMDDLLAQRSLIDDGVAVEIQPLMTPLGITIESVALRDLGLVGAAKSAYADLWKAQKEGLAALERARGEQAALRALNNAARMLKGNPELMNLRLLQAVAGGPGKPAATLVLGGGGGLLPVSNNTEAPPAEE